MTRIKICGITSVDDALAACKVGAHAIGLVFAESPRRVTRETAAEIIRNLPPFVTTVGVFVDEAHDTVRETMQYCGIHVAQLHGNEKADFCRSLGWPFLKAFRLNDANTLETIRTSRYNSFLVDSFQTGLAGGTGRTANWELAADAARLGRMVLAGGLNPENVRTALERVRPYAVDVSSGVELSPGIKDTIKMKQFIKEVQTWDIQTNGVISGSTAAGLFPRR